jgi:hypothetical protein
MELVAGVDHPNSFGFFYVPFYSIESSTTSRGSLGVGGEGVS